MKGGPAIATALCLVSGAAWAQTPRGTPAPPVAITVDDAIARGLAASHRLAEAIARGDVAQAAVAQRRAAALPQIAAQAGYTRTNHVEAFGLALPNGRLQIIYPDVPDNYRTRLDLQWPIYTGGRVDALERAARGEAAAAGQDVAATRADLRLEITRAYWALVTATESQRVVDESVGRVDAQLADVRHQLDAGLIPPNDVLTVEAQASHQRMLSVQAHSLREVAESQLAYLIGAEPGTALAATSPLEPVPGPTPSADALAQTARRQRPERAALDARLGAAGDRTRAARAEAKPTIAIGGGGDYARPNPRIFPRDDVWSSSWDASVNVSWPIFDGGRARADIAEAEAGRRAAQERLREFDAALPFELQQRTSEVASSRAAIAAAEDGVRAATEARRVVGDRFAAGVATSTDVLNAQVALLQAALDRTQALAAARLAEARLSRALGQ
jgi:outer membrane protein TolC